MKKDNHPYTDLLAGTAGAAIALVVKTNVRKGRLPQARKKSITAWRVRRSPTADM